MFVCGVCLCLVSAERNREFHRSLSTVSCLSYCSGSFLRTHSPEASHLYTVSVSSGFKAVLVFGVIIGYCLCRGQCFLCIRSHIYWLLLQFVFAVLLLQDQWAASRLREASASVLSVFSCDITAAAESLWQCYCGLLLLLLWNMACRGRWKVMLLSPALIIKLQMATYYNKI